MDCRSNRRLSGSQAARDFRGCQKEAVSGGKNGGREWQETQHPDEVNVYDFSSLTECKATPYGVYGMTQNEGWVNVGIDRREGGVLPDPVAV